MLQTSESLDLIARYLNDPTDPGLRSEVISFRSSSIEHDALFLEIEKIWEQAAVAKRLDEIDERGAVDRFKKALKQHTVSRYSNRTWWRGVAAAVVLFLAGYWIYGYNTQPIFIVKTTAKNQVDSVTLADGSTIILAENTELRYPDKFSSNTRQIYLSKGQAFFKIAKDVNHPFKVVMNKSDVVVLGTSFNIRLVGTRIELGVKTGRVLFSPYENGATSILTAGQALTYDTEKKEFATKNAQNEDSWLTKELIFVDTPLEEVCEQLTNYYGVVIKLQEGKHVAKKLNAKFQDQSLNDVLIVLNETYNIKVKKEHQQINLITP